ncbi:hypothetical protein ACQEVY_36285 [Streptomyces sp. CA-288835]|uniref:hypothetical protein n=1 Tax=Streptomyces sp. CA-288835 TaxID=3240069 RepID=UPI003D92C2AE
MKGEQPMVDEGGALQFWIRAADGSEAELIADKNSVLVLRPHRGAVFDIIAELVSRLGAVVIDPTWGRAACREEERAHLPTEMQEEAIVIEMTGEALASLFRLHTGSVAAETRRCLPDLGR